MPKQVKWSEIIEQNKTGFLIKEQDTNAFASALEQLITNQELRTTMGHNATIAIQRFYVENIIPHWIDLFGKLI